MKTKAQKRVDLAKDVLKQLRAGKFEPAQGTYCRPADALLDRPVCEVCALGAMLVACCGADNAAYASADTIKGCLLPLFSLPQITLIEAAFEGSAAMPMTDYGKRKVMGATRAADMFPWHMPAAVKLRAIMRNLIDNGGTFVVPKA